MDPRTERVVKNESVFREVNERINEVTRGDPAEYHCECADATCTETIPMTVADYEDTRTEPTHFAVLPGHEIPDLEEVVKRNAGFLVVRKKAGAPAEHAAAKDPRN
jgi:hypothetical protein